MITRSDAPPLGAEAAEPPRLQRQIWSLRLAGLALLVAAWFTVSVREFGSSFFIVETVVFGLLGAYGFLAAASGQRAAVDREKRLRLRLLVRNMELEKLTMRDDVTQLYNRRYLFEQLERELEAAKGHDRPLAVVIADLDSFAALNDSFGHRIGDRVLTNFGRLLLDRARTRDVPARIGNDEFAIILPGTSEQAARNVVKRLTEATARTDLIDEDGLTLPITASFAISGFPWGGDTVDTIIDDAVASLTRGKPHDNGEVPAVFRKSLESFDDPPDEESAGP